ncbi:insecticidal delta-endotoxin Cry8Ea1 family protein [Bacillus cereus]
METVSELYPVPYNVLASSIQPSVIGRYDETNTSTIKDLDAFKDLMNKIKAGEIGTTIYNLFKGIVETGKIDYFGLLKTVLSVASGFIPQIGFVTPVLNFIFPLIFGSPEPDVFEQLKPRIQEMIDENLIEDETTFLSQTVGSVQTHVKAYYNAIILGTAQNASDENFKAIPGAVNKVLEDIESSLSYFTNFNKANSKGTLRQNVYEVISIPYYTMLTSMYLLILRDAITNAKKWGIPSDTIDNTTVGYKVKFYQQVNTFTQEIMKKYQIASQVTRDKVNNKSKNDPPRLRFERCTK